MIEIEGSKAILAEDRPLILDSGCELQPIRVAYKTYGKLNYERSNCVLICHALTGDQFVASTNPFTNENAWWPNVVGPHKVVNTDKYFVICSNILGGCMGTSGPTDRDENGYVVGMRFPLITIGDMVKAQERLITSLGIERLFCILGGSMGGMQVLEWVRRYPERMISAAAIATSYRNSTQNIAFNEVGRQAIISDPNWRNGEYDKFGIKPVRGLSIARMIGHITYLSTEGMQIKFGRLLQHRSALSYEMNSEFSVEGYLEHQGSKFVKRFDANSYLYLTKAMDYFDLEYASGKPLSDIFVEGSARLYIASFSSDWLFPNSESVELVEAMREAGRDVVFEEFESENGHDAFLLDEPEFHDSLHSFFEMIQQG